MDFIIRAADDTPSLALPAAHLIWDSSRHFLGYIYAGNQPRGFTDLQYQWLQPTGLLSHRQAIVAASRDGVEIFGLALFMPSEQMTQEADITSAHMDTLATERVIPDFNKRLEAMNYYHPVVPATALYLQNIAVRSNTRGCAIDYELFQAVIEQARRRGFTSLHLDVVSDNPAIAFYRRQGLEIVSETNMPALWTKHEQPSRYRMVLDIAES